MSVERLPSAGQPPSRQSDEQARLAAGEHSSQGISGRPDDETDVAANETTPFPMDATALARYQDLYAHMTEGVVFQDADGRIIDANPAAEHLLGLTMEQLVGRTSFDPRWRAIHLDGTEVPAATHPAVVALRTGQAVRDAIVGVFIPGEERHRWLRVNAIPRLVPDRERPVGVFVTFDDITEWDYLKESARIQEARYQALLEQAADAIFVADLEGRYIEVNPAACALLGYEREELLGKRIVDLIPPDDVSRLEAVRTELLQGQTQRGEWRLRRKDGLLVPVELSARILSDGRWQAMVRDITARKQLEADLRRAERASAAAEARFRAVIEQAPDALISIDANGRIELVNRQTELLFGYARNTLLGKPVERLIPQRLHGRHRMHRAIYAAHPRVRPMGANQQLAGRRADGIEFPVEVSLAPIGTNGGTHILATCRDMTERRQLERALHERAEQLTRTFEAMHEGVYIYNGAGELVQMNATARQVAGYDLHPELEREATYERLRRLQPRDVAGHTIPMEDWPVQRALRGEVIAPSAPLEMTITSAAGHDVILDITGAPLQDAEGGVMGAVVVTRDVTEQRSLERELAARAQEIERIFETDADAVMLFDNEGRTLRMNGAQRRLLGYDATQQVGYISPEERARKFSISDVHGQPLPQEAWPIYRVLRGETLVGLQAVEMSLRTLDGRDLQLSVSGSPVLDQEGRIVGGVTASRDVTEQRRLEQERMDILRVVAHDLAGPLTAMKLHLQMQQRSLEHQHAPLLPDPALLESVAYAMVRMERLLGDMRVAVDLESSELGLDFHPCDLVALCQQEVRSMQIAERRPLHLNLPDEPIVVHADRDRIGQVLANLLSNADKYSPIERPITLTLRLERSTPDADTQATHYARVLVQDAGPGIPESEQEHVWKRFHRVAGIHALPGMGPSLGLGLYISREIIERHGGTVGVESTPGDGSTFWFTLPLAPSAERINEQDDVH
jgi:PAS domain S-box-containing protein